MIGAICDVPVQSRFLAWVQSQKSCVSDRHNKLHLDIFNVQQCLGAEEVFPTKSILVSAGGVSRAFPGAVCIVHSQ